MSNKSNLICDINIIIIIWIESNKQVFISFVWYNKKKSSLEMKLVYILNSLASVNYLRMLMEMKMKGEEEHVSFKWYCDWSN